MHRILLNFGNKTTYDIVAYNIQYQVVRYNYVIFKLWVVVHYLVLWLGQSYF